MKQDPTQLIQLVKTALSGPQNNIPSYQHFGFSSSPNVDSTDYIIIHTNGDENYPVAIASNDQQFRPTNMNPGEVKIYDAFGNYVYFQNGKLTINTSGNVTMNVGGTFTVNGPVKVNGAITATGIIHSQADVTTSGISLATHQHTGVEEGSGDSGPPI